MNQPIGMLDSGVGGLTVAKELMRQLPKEQIIYIGDTKRCPYGPRTKEEVRAFTWELVDFLLKYNIKMLVIACNTATAAALEELQAKLPIPVVGVIYPGAHAAIKNSESNHIGVIGTEGTVKSNAYENALLEINGDVTITSVACPSFVPIVEEDRMEEPETLKVVAESLLPFKGKNIDTLILGCTHYPLLAETIQKVIGQNVKLINSGAETARELSAILKYNKTLNLTKRENEHKFFTTGDREIFYDIASKWLKKTDLHVESIDL